MNYPQNVILRGLVGSGVHGVAIDGTDDRDEMGVCVEPPEHFFGLRSRFEQYEYRSQPRGIRSGPGDLDLTIYSLAKFARLALAGNPSVLVLLFVPEDRCTVLTDQGRALRALAPRFVGNNIFGPYLGYMKQTRLRLTENRKMPRRPELVARYGYDTKYAGHLIRLGYQGVEMATTGRLTLPMVKHERQRILDIRNGVIVLQAVLDEAVELESRLAAMKGHHDLLDPDVSSVERFVVDQYLGR